MGPRSSGHGGRFPGSVERHGSVSRCAMKTRDPESKATELITPALSRGASALRAGTARRERAGRAVRISTAGARLMERRGHLRHEWGRGRVAGGLQKPEELAVTCGSSCALSFEKPAPQWLEGLINDLGSTAVRFNDGSPRAPLVMISRAVCPKVRVHRSVHRRNIGSRELGCDRRADNRETGARELEGVF